MRGRCLAVSVLYLVLAMAGGASAATRTTPMTAPKALVAPVIDGVMSPGEWQGEPFGGGLINNAWMEQHGQFGRVNFNTPSWPGVADDDQFSCYIYMMWDESYLYICIDATASNPTPMGPMWTGETVQVIVDPTGTGGTNQYSFNWSSDGSNGPNGGCAFGNGVNPIDNDSRLVAYSAPKPDGYVMETKIPLDMGQPAITPAEGNVFGLMLALLILEQGGSGVDWTDIWMLGGPDPEGNPFTTPGPLSPITLGPAILPETRTTAMTAPKALVAPAIDGVMSPGEWQGEPFGGGLINNAWMEQHGQFGRVNFNTPSWPGVADDDQFSCYIHMMWDESYLYICIDATASNPTPMGPLWSGETVQAIVDPTGTGGTNQYSFNWSSDGSNGPNGGCAFGNGVNPIDNDSRLVAYSAPKPGGYVMETKIPLDMGQPAIAPTEGSVLGLMLALLILEQGGSGVDWIDIWMLGGPDPQGNPFTTPGPLSPITLGPAIQVNPENVITAEPAGPWFQAGQQLALLGPAGFSNYRWTKDSVPLVDSDRVYGAAESTLVLNPLDLEDAGHYACTYDDGTGAIVSTPLFTLDVMPAGALPVTDVLGLAAVFAALGLGGGMALRRRAR